VESEVPPVNLDGQHPEYGHVVLVYFDVDGRMQFREKARRCHSPEAHVREVTVNAVLTDCDQPDAPPGSSAWMVHAGGPDADGARKVALTAGKSLGAQLNPILRQLGVEK
jgi:hypothetical protein